MKKLIESMLVSGVSLTIDAIERGIIYKEYYDKVKRDQDAWKRKRSLKVIEGGGHSTPKKTGHLKVA